MASDTDFELLNAMIAWETGEITEELEVLLFQYLIDKGSTWTLQGAYGRNAQYLIDVGLCHRKEN